MVVIAGTSLAAAPAPSEAAEGARSGPGPQLWLRKDDGVANTSIPAPVPPAGGDVVRAAQAAFEVNYTGFPAEARSAFQAAVDIWASYVTSPVPIVIDASWLPLDPGILGGARFTDAWANFAEAPQPNTWYVSALVNALHGSDIAPDESDITAVFNSANTHWYFGTDGHPPAGTYDFETVVLHELAHGLGFSGSMFVNSSGFGSWGSASGSPFAYDRFARNGSGTALVSFPNNSVGLGNALQSNDVFFSGTHANAANGGSQLKLYAPNAWQLGTSFVHLDEATYPAGDPNSLMTPFLHAVESIHAPGPGALGVPEDIGWRVSASPPPVGVPVERIYGQDAIGTSLAISQSLFTAGSASAVVLARSDYFSDALAGGPLASAHDAPLLITPGAASSSALDPRVLAEISRVLPAGHTVFVLGGPFALAPGIDTTLTSLGYSVERVQGANQYSTATAIAERLGYPSVVFEATGSNFADALSAVPAAVNAHGAILLTNGNQQAPETAAYLAAHPPTTRYVIGGPLAAAGADPGATAVYGQDLFATSAAVASRFFPGTESFGAATGATFPDALSGGVFMSGAAHTGPVLLVNPALPVPPSVADYLATHPSITHGYLFGGPLAVDDGVLGAV